MGQHHRSVQEARRPPGGGRTILRRGRRLSLVVAVATVAAVPGPLASAAAPGGPTALALAHLDCATESLVPVPGCRRGEPGDAVARRTESVPPKDTAAAAGTTLETGRGGAAGDLRSPAAGNGAARLPAGVTTAAGTAAGGTAAVTYPASDAVLANPERGFTHYTQTRWSPDGSAYTPLNDATLRGWRSADAVTVVYRVFYLEGLAGRDQVDARFLSQVAADFATARSAGVKLVVRFAYSADTSVDAPVQRAVGHVRQLAAVVNAADDVVWILQAGFIGRWGEWYYSDSYASDPQRPWNLSAADWARRGQLLDALLGSVSPRVHLQVRYPAIVQRLLSGDPRAARVGIHDDCFLASETDMGTYASAADRNWLAQRSATVPVGGETCGVNLPRSGWNNASAELQRYHWRFLNADFDTSVLQSWGPAALAGVARDLGPRLRLVSATLPDAARPGATSSVTLTLTNDGYAAPLDARPVQLVFQGTASAVVVAVPLDVRTLAPGATRTVTAQVTAPPVPGVYRLLLALPDPAPSLAGNPAYAVQLANVGTWNAASGRNDLRHSVAVSG